MIGVAEHLSSHWPFKKSQVVNKYANSEYNNAFMYECQFDYHVINVQKLLISVFVCVCARARAFITATTREREERRIGINKRMFYFTCKHYNKCSGST